MRAVLRVKDVEVHIAIIGINRRLTNSEYS